MSDKLRIRFWVEMGLAAASAMVCLVTAIWSNWIEIVFNIDPDHNSGSLEWLIVAVTLALAVTAAGAARYEWRRRLAATA
jgi:uncharacterized membrane protein YphA (DoxX/SURF4 family)